MTELHGWCRPCHRQVDNEDVLDHAARQHPQLLAVVTYEEDTITDFGDVVAVDVA